MASKGSNVIGNILYAYLTLPLFRLNVYYVMRYRHKVLSIILNYSLTVNLYLLSHVSANWKIHPQSLNMRAVQRVCVSEVQAKDLEVYLYVISFILVILDLSNVNIFLRLVELHWTSSAHTSMHVSIHHILSDAIEYIQREYYYTVGRIAFNLIEPH